MHRILNIAGNEKNNDDLIEQPVADFIFITSVKADLNLLSNLMLEKEFTSLKNNIRALEISNLNSSAVILASKEAILLPLFTTLSGSKYTVFPEDEES